MLVTKDNLFKLGDFTASCLLEDPSNANSGSKKYMSPEAMQNIISTQNDVWGLGLVIYELCQTESPELVKTYAQHDFKTPIIPGHFSADLREIVVKMLQSDYTKRPTAKQILSLDWVGKVEGKTNKIEENFFVSELSE